MTKSTPIQLSERAKEKIKRANLLWVSKEKKQQPMGHPWKKRFLMKEEVKENKVED